MPSSDEEKSVMTSRPVQYSMRSLLMMMGVMTVLAAIAGSYYRRCSPEGQTYLLVFWASILSALAWFYWSFERKRLKLMGNAGECLMRLPSVQYHFWASSNVVNWGGFFIVGYATFLLFTNSVACEQMASQGSTHLSVAAHGILAGMYFVLGIYLVQSGGDVQFCENGIPWKQSLIRWSEIRRITPNLRAKHDDRTVYSLQGNPMFRVPPQLREQVDEMIAEKLGEQSGRSRE